MNEPSVFNGPEITMHKDAQHHGGAEHRELHNVYGLYYQAATAEGLRRRGAGMRGGDGDRPFVLTRAFFAGSQRVGPMWTGDNGAEWPHLAASVPMLLSASVAGMPFSGADVGGFFGNPDAELSTRWYQVGAFYPFFRGHAHLEAKRREPWLFGEPATGRIRAAIRERYRLLPYLYSLFLHANATGAPVMRPLWWEFPGVAGLEEEEALFMLGPAVLVAPVLAAGEEAVRAVLPGGGRWYDGADGAAVAGAAALAGAAFNVSAPLDAGARHWLRGGAALALRERARRSSAAAARDPLTLVLALDAAGAAAGDLYLDDGASFAYARGQYAHRAFALSPGGALVAAAAPRAPGFPPADPRYDPGVLIDRVVVLGLPGGPAGWRAELVAGGGAGPRALEAAPGPLRMQPGAPDNALVLRRVALPAAGDWTVQLSRAPPAATA
jgi:alpha 1,3-glucosidase